MEKLRASSDVQIETVLTDTKSMKRIKISIETDEQMPKNKGQVIFEFDGLLVVSATQCKNVVHNFVNKLNK